VGFAVAVWFLWEEGYRRNEMVIWSWVLGGLAVGALLQVWVSFSDQRRVCRTCGVQANPARAACVKCGQNLDWHSVRPLVKPQQSPIPAMRKSSEAPWQITVLVPLVVVGTMLLSNVGFPGARVLGTVLARLMVVVLLVLGFRQRRALDGVEGRLRESGGRLCSICLYARNDGADRCPECGVRETEDELRALWERSGLWIREDTRNEAAK
jgi:RNA polymerase subunit RPABC4/transcription elongation factor Spt4